MKVVAYGVKLLLIENLNLSFRNTDMTLVVMPNGGMVHISGNLHSLLQDLRAQRNNTCTIIEYKLKLIYLRHQETFILIRRL